MENRFRMAVICPVCRETIRADGWTIDFTNPAGVVVLDLFACMEFECDCCGTVVYTGDVEQMYEYEEGNCGDEDSDDEEEF